MSASNSNSNSNLSRSILGGLAGGSEDDDSWEISSGSRNNRKQTKRRVNNTNNHRPESGNARGAASDAKAADEHCPSTGVCKFYLKGMCKFGSRCSSPHDLHASSNPSNTSNVASALIHENPPVKVNPIKAETAGGKLSFVSALTPASSGSSSKTELPSVQPDGLSPFKGLVDRLESVSLLASPSTKKFSHSLAHPASVRSEQSFVDSMFSASFSENTTSAPLAGFFHSPSASPTPSLISKVSTAKRASVAAAAAAVVESPERTSVNPIIASPFVATGSTPSRSSRQGAKDHLVDFDPFNPFASVPSNVTVFENGILLDSHHSHKHQSSNKPKSFADIAKSAASSSTGPAENENAQSGVVDKGPTIPIFAAGPSQSSSVASSAMAPNAAYSENGPSTNQRETSSLCPFAINGNCRFGSTCRYVHGMECPSCHRFCLHPYNHDQAEEHLKVCHGSAHDDDVDENEIECGICFEKILSKPDARFGLLNCNHPFCLTCIRNWRASNSHGLDPQAIRSCPTCRTVTHFITPSAIWIRDPEEKSRLIEEYKRKLSAIPCKYFNYGDSQCPFGTSCFYAHILKDGTREQTKLRIYMNGDEEVKVVNSVKLCDFLLK